MQIVVLVAMGVSMLLLADTAPLRGAPVWVVAVAGVGYWAVTAALSGACSAMALRALAAPPDANRRALRRRMLLTVTTRAWLVGGLAGLIMLGYGRWIIRDLGLDRWPLASQAAAVTPFIVALLLNWILEYPLHRAGRLRLAGAMALTDRRPPPIWTLGEFLANNIRHHLLFILVPVGLIVGLTDVLELYVGPRLPDESAPWIVAIASLVAAGAVFLVSPLLIVRIWRTEPLEDGPLRRELEAMSRRMHLRFRDMLVWKSGGVIANAGVIGVLPSLRYVLLSDALLADMPDRHIQAIFAHEAGHVKHKHILFAVLFVLTVVTFCSLTAEVIERLAGLTMWQGQGVALALVAACFAVGFGWVSRRFERQSDVTAAWVSSWEHDDGHDAPDTVTPEGAKIFAEALEGVAYLNGMRAGGSNWRHGSIAWRVSYIRWLGSRRGSRREIGEVVWRIKTLVLLGLALMVGVTIWQALGGP